MNEIMNLAHRIKVAVLAEVGKDYNSMLDSRVASIDHVTQKIVDEFTCSDYWTRLEHQYAGMAMQGLLTNSNLIKILRDENVTITERTHVFSEWARMYAHALVEKYKKEEK